MEKCELQIGMINLFGGITASRKVRNRGVRAAEKESDREEI